MPTIDQHLEDHAAEFEEQLCELLRIPSVSADPNHQLSGPALALKVTGDPTLPGYGLFMTSGR